jgi:serine/threonine-protein kinase
VSAVPPSGEHARPDPLIGRTLAGKFRLESFVGAGAMGAVYRASQLALEKPVAIKVLTGALAVDPSFAARFAREAKAAARLDHPNSIRVFDFGQEPDGLLYIAMELVEGSDLATEIQLHGPMPPERIVDILSQVLAALAVAHEMGVLHRDLKPANVMLLKRKDDDGKPVDFAKVCDFGIAKLLDTSREDPGRRYLTGGLVVGTPEYMAPEQARGEELDARSDLYSVGIVLYQMLTACVPFDAATALSIVVKHVTEIPAPPSSACPGVHPGLEAICMKALSKNPADRFQSATEMRVALRAELNRTASSAERPSGAGAKGPTFSRSAPTLPRVGNDGPPATLAGVTPAKAFSLPRRSRTKLAAAALILASGVALLVRLRPVEKPAPKSSEPPLAPMGAAPSAPASTLVVTATVATEPLAIPIAPQAASTSAASAGPAPAARTKVARTTGAAPKSAQNAEPVAAVFQPPAPAQVQTPSPAPSPVPSSAPPVPPPAVAIAMTPPPDLLESPPSAPAPQARFDLSSARVVIEPAIHVTGATAVSVNRAVAGAGPLLTSCYREALPQMNGPVEGELLLHIETDGAGTIEDARVTGALSPSVGRCATQAVRGRRIANVDTGSASADVPLAFKSR